MSTRRITVKQSDDTVKQVAFLDDITLDGITGSGLITVTGDTEKTVTTDTTKLTVGTQGDVKVVTPLELQTSAEAPSVPGSKLYNVEGNLYWNGEKIASQSWVSTNYTDKEEFDTVSDKVDTIEGNYIKDITGTELSPVHLSFGRSLTPNTLTSSVSVVFADQDADTKALSGDGLVSGVQAQAAIDAAVADGVEEAIAEYDETVIGSWSDGSTFGTVKSAVEINAAKIKALEGNHFEVVDELPDVSEGKFNVIYLVPDTADPTVKDEYILIEEGEPATRKWEQIGTTKADLSNYFTKAETTSAIDTKVGVEETRAKAAEATLTAAVNEVAGKADTAVQTVTSGDTANVQVQKTDTDVTITPIGTLANLLAYCSIEDV